MHKDKTASSERQELKEEGKITSREGEKVSDLERGLKKDREWSSLKGI